KPSALGAASGIVAGLVVITPAAGFVTPGSALIMGLLAGVVCYGGVLMKHKLGYDDSLDAFGVHGVGGAFGAILTGVFASVGAAGLIAGNPGQVLIQLIGVLASGAYAAIVTAILLFILKPIMGLRVDAEDEAKG
ncbi:MAG: ammonium transporter, partial [Desulfuromonadales bacterium]|nr:ammonium transporter [Desulfuromonadales bacterium]NIS39597.1 ammonium transporter [Desulfuromonadales bacterium]